MSGRLRIYVALVTTVAFPVFIDLVMRVNFARLRAMPAGMLAAIALLTLFLMVDELVPIQIRHRDEVREVTVTTTFAFALVMMAGTAIGVGAVVLASVISDLARRKGLAKLAFNASQYTISLTAGGAVYHWLGGTAAVDAHSLLALAAGTLSFALVNYLLVSTVIGLAQDVPIVRELRHGLSLEALRVVLLVALTPVTVVVAEHTAWLLPALLLPLAAVSVATKGRAEAEEAAVRQLRLTEQEQEVVRRLQEADRMKADLLATVTHELRSPLTTILGALQLLHSREGRLSRAERHEFVAMGLRQGERLQRLIEQLLLAAKFEQQEPGVVMRDLERVEFDASELVRQAGAEAMARHLQRPIAVETNGPLPVRAAQDAIVQVLDNLIDNAVKYSPEGRPIRLLGLRHGDDAVLAVEDTGAGIPDTDRQRIFERFAQLDRHSDQRDGGVGLGLYIARQLARSQDGELLVTDTDTDTDTGNGGGTRFELRLPLVD